MSSKGISRAGNSRLRRTMVQLAWLWLRHQPGSELSCWFRERVGDQRGKIRRITIVAVARKLLVALWPGPTVATAPASSTLSASIRIASSKRHVALANAPATRSPGASPTRYEGRELLNRSGLAALIVAA
jgi:hypothetical protein